MRAVARVGDPWAGVCTCHKRTTAMTGIVQNGSPNVKANSLSVARIGDTVLGACGHSGLIITGSTDVKVETLGIVRVGDTTTGCLIGSIVGGSPDVFAN